MITTQKFNGILKSIRSTGAKLDALIAEGVQYCAEQAQNGNFDPFAKLLDACPVYARKVVRDAEKGIRKAHKEKALTSEAVEQAAADTAAELTERRTRQKRKSASEAEAKRKAEAEAKRKRVADAEAKREAEAEAKAEAAGERPKGRVVSQGGELRHAGGGDPLLLTEAEYQAALAAIEALRKGETKTA